MYNIEMYTPINHENPEANYCEIWIPLKKLA